MIVEFQIAGVDHRIRPDTYGWVLERLQIAQKGKKAGEQTAVVMGYYGKLSQAVERLSEEVARIEPLCSVLNEMRNLRGVVECMDAKIREARR